MSGTASVRGVKLSSIGVVLGVGVSTAGAFAVNLAVPHLLSVGGAADYFIATSLVTVASLLLRFGMDKSVVRATAEADAAGDDSAAARLGLTAVVFSIVLLAGAALIGPWAWPTFVDHAYGHGPLSELGWVMSIWMAAEAGRLLLSEFLRGKGRIFVATVLGDAGRALLLCALFFALFFIGTDRLEDVILAASVSSAVLLVLAGIATLRTVGGQGWRPQHPFKALSCLLLVSFPFYVTSLWGFATTQSDILVGGFTLAKHELAYYAAASKLALAATLPTVALTLLLAPSIPRYWQAGDRSGLELHIRRTTTLFFVATAPVVVVFVFASGFVMTSLFPEPYIEGAPTLAILTIGSLFVAATGPNGFLLLMTEHSTYVARITSIVGATQLVAMILAAARWGPYGLAAASTAGTAALNLLFTVKVHRALGMRTDLGMAPWRHWSSS